jgi:hypothetical protein
VARQLHMFIQMFTSGKVIWGIQRALQKLSESNAHTFLSHYYNLHFVHITGSVAIGNKVTPCFTLCVLLLWLSMHSECILSCNVS